MRVFVHQPEYIPWIGFFDKLARCDTFVIYDDAQYQHGGFHNRNKIRNRNGWEWLTIPIKHGHPQTIKDVKISGDEWKNKHLSALILNYEKAPYFKDYFPIIKDAISFNHELLIGLNLHLIRAVSDILGIKPIMMRSSEFPYGGKEKNEKLVSMCKFLGADTYLCGSGGKNYVDETMFSQANIKLEWHSYTHPAYDQRFEGFEPNMSVIDLLFNMGPDAKGILMKGGAVTASRVEDVQLITQPLTVQTGPKVVA